MFRKQSSFISCFNPLQLQIFNFSSIFWGHVSSFGVLMQLYTNPMEASPRNPDKSKQLTVSAVLTEHYLPLRLMLNKNGQSMSTAVC